MKTTTAALVVLFATTSAVGAEPLWVMYPKLTCRYDGVQFCNLDMSACRSAVGTAVLAFDFQAGTIHSFVSTKLQTIDSKHHFESKFGDSNSVFSDGTLYSFIGVTHNSVVADTIEGVAQSGSKHGAFNAHMTCHPS